jgi:hypothetical protein
MFVSDVVIDDGVNSLSLRHLRLNCEGAQPLAQCGSSAPLSFDVAL